MTRTTNNSNNQKGEVTQEEFDTLENEVNSNSTNISNLNDRVSLQSVKVGEDAGTITPGTLITAVGYNAGRLSQGDQAVAVGFGAGELYQGAN